MPPPTATCVLANRLLDLQHPHPRDEQIFFDPGSATDPRHDYYVDWDGTGTFECDGAISITALIEAFFEAFNRDLVIDRIVNSKRYKAGKSEYSGKTRVEIAQEFVRKRNRGTGLHDFIECFYQAEKTWDDLPAGPHYQQFRDFATAKERVPWRAEHRLFTDRRTKVTGTPDMTFVNEELMKALRQRLGREPEDLHVELFDWKCVEKLDTYSYGRYGKGLLNHVPDAKFFRYALQLNAYKKMLETYYQNVVYRGHTYKRIVVDRMFICTMHPKNKTYGVFLMPNFQKEIEQILELRAESLRRRAEGLPGVYPLDADAPPPPPPADDVFAYLDGLEEDTPQVTYCNAAEPGEKRKRDE